MGQCIAKIKHEACGSNQGLQVFEEDDGSVTGFCFSCNTYVKHPYGEPKRADEVEHTHVPRTPEQIQAQLEEIKGYQTVNLPHKKLKAEMLKEFGIKVGLSEQDGHTPVSVHYPYYKGDELVGFKTKIIENKRVYSVGSTKGCDPFNWHKAKASGARKLVITEGEDDAAAVLAIIKRYTTDQYKELIPAVISLPNGAGGASKDLARIKEEIDRKFKEVVLCFDMDKPGRDAVAKTLLLFPDAVTVELPEKDPCDCILAGKAKAAFNAITFNAAKPKNTSLVFGESLHDTAKVAAKWGELSWPWQHMNDITRGIRYGETYYIGAGVKMGKSELLNAVAAHVIQVHGVKIFMAKPEESNNKTYKLLAGKLVGKVFHDPKIEFDEEAYERAGEVMKGHVAMMDVYQNLGWETLKADIISAAHWGAKVVFIDPITNLTNGMDPSSANTALQDIAQSLAQMAKDLDIAIFIFCHLKAHAGEISGEQRKAAYKQDIYTGLGNCSHERGGTILSTQFSGSRAMMRSCNYMIGLEGNKDPDLPEEVRNIRTLCLLEDREFGESGKFPIYWEKATSLFKEI